MTDISLFDIAPPTEIVSIGGVDHKVRGLPLRIVASLINDYPQLVGFLSGGGLTAEAIVEQGPKAVSLIIAAGYGVPDDEKAIKAAADLPFDVQIDLIAGIVKATLGGGTGPFVEKIKTLYQSFGVITAAQTEQRADAIEIAKARLSKLRSQSALNSSKPEADTQPTKFGT